MCAAGKIGTNARPLFTVFFQSTHSLKLNCALTEFLREAAGGDAGPKAAFAAVMLADLGLYVASDSPGLAHLKPVSQILMELDQPELLWDMSNICERCSLVANCAVGKAILNG